MFSKLNSSYILKNVCDTMKRKEFKSLLCMVPITTVYKIGRSGAKAMSGGLCHGRYGLC